MSLFTLKWWSGISGLKMAHKLVFWIVSSLLITSLLLSFLFDYSAKTALINRTVGQLESVKILKDGWLHQYLDNEKQQLKFVFQACSTHNANSPKNQKIENLSLDQFIQQTLLVNKIALIDSNQSINRDPTNLSVRERVPDSIKQRLIHLKTEHWTLVAHPSDSVLWLVLKVNTQQSLVKEIKLKNLTNILTQRTGMGETGESYMVDENRILRTESRFLKGEKAKIVIRTTSVDGGLRGLSGTAIIKDYRGVEVLSSFKPFVFLDLKWVLISEIDYSELMISVYELRKTLVFLTFFVLLIGILVTLWLSALFTKPIKKLNDTIRELSLGKVPSFSKLSNGTDEIVEMTESVNRLSEGLQKTASFAENIGRGELNHSYQTLSSEDVLGYALLNMRTQLISLNEKVVLQNKIKAIALLEGQEKERQRISRDLHDGVGQMLTALRFRLQSIENSVSYQSEIKELIDSTVVELKRVVVNLMPSVIWDVGLEAAIKILIQNAKPLNVTFSYHKSEDAPSLSLDKRLTVYRIIQECINNTLKHAQTDQLVIEIKKSTSEFYLMVQDFGKGFLIDDSATKEHITYGLKNIKERVYLVSGKCEIVSVLNQGTILKIWIPLTNE